jgi:hypothetical protein
MHVEADAAAVDLAGAHLDEPDSARRQAALLGHEGHAIERFLSVGKQSGVVKSCGHDDIPPGKTEPLSHRLDFVRQHPDGTREGNVTDA